MPMLKLASHSLHYQLDGPPSAPALLLSNSLGTTLDMWRPQLAALSRRYRVLRYDARGHGASTASAECGLADLAGDALSLLDALDIERAHFCGISMGGLTGLWLGAYAPERLQCLVVSNSAAKIGKSEAWAAARRPSACRRHGGIGLQRPSALVQPRFLRQGAGHRRAGARLACGHLAERLRRLLRGAGRRRPARGLAAHRHADFADRRPA
ncbi:alpha/beta fold hydrolase [Chromobacterium haemolyticum]|nr:alpha/beta fold hydrolase [Chromobacterium haemolyticum]